MAWLPAGAGDHGGPAPVSARVRDSRHDVPFALVASEALVRGVRRLRAPAGEPEHFGEIVRASGTGGSKDAGQVHAGPESGWA